MEVFTAIGGDKRRIQVLSPIAGMEAMHTMNWTKNQLGLDIFLSMLQKKTSN